MRALFRADVDPTSEAWLAAEPAPAGTPQPSSRSAVRVVEETTTSLQIAAEVATPDAYLVTLDAYDPRWEVRVDGAPATLLRAFGVLRGVRLAQGAHTVAFRYASTPLRAGTMLSVLALCAVVWLALSGRSARAG
jgi:hypothetical protein